MASPTTRHLTILITDIKGFTDKTSHRSRADIQRLLDDHRDVVLPVLEGRGGHLVKTMGDAFMMTYDSPTDAVLAGVAAQEALAKHNHDLPEADRIEIRVAINAGEVNLADNDVFGEAVNITARIEGVAEAGEVYFTEAVYLAMNKTEVPSSEIGLLQLKGIPEKVRVYKVRRETPVGTAQMPPRPAPVAASGFAPGEKARLDAPTTVPKVVSVWKRARAFMVDAFLVTLLLPGVSAVLRDVGVLPPPSPASISVSDDGIGVQDDEGARVELNRGELRVEARTKSRSRAKRVLLPILWVLYNFLFLWRMSGATLGKKLLCLRVRSEDGSPLSVKQAFLRSLVSVGSAYAMGLGYFWAFWDPCKRTWHDALAGTRVVSTE